MVWLYVYIGIVVASLILEFTTNEMVSIWFCGGAIVAGILSAFDLSWYIHLPVFIAVSGVLLLSFRKIVLKYLDKGEIKTNADSAIGKEFVLETAIGFNQPGSIKVNGVVWSAITEDQKAEVPEGTVVTVKNLKGNKYIVEVK